MQQSQQVRSNHSAVAAIKPTDDLLVEDFGDYEVPQPAPTPKDPAHKHKHPSKVFPSPSSAFKQLHAAETIPTAPVPAPISTSAPNTHTHKVACCRTKKPSRRGSLKKRDIRALLQSDIGAGAAAVGAVRAGRGPWRVATTVKGAKPDSGQCRGVAPVAAAPAQDNTNPTDAMK